MADLWLPGFQVVPGESSGTWADHDDGTHIGVVHTTEGLSLQAALGAYRQNRSWPHTTVGGPDRVRIQHLPLNVPARALKNTSAPGQTNREPRVIQVEILGFAGQSHTWDDDYLDWLGRNVIGPMSLLGRVPLTTSVEFYGADCGWTLASPTARQRLSREQWDTYSGWLGHQHVIENDHWDPGGLDMARILAAARGHLPPTPAPIPAPSGEPTMLIFREPAQRGQVFACDNANGTRRHIDREELDDIVQAGGVRHQDPAAKAGWNPPKATGKWLYDLKVV